MNKKFIPLFSIVLTLTTSAMPLKGWTDLHEAARLNDSQTLQILITSNADVNATDCMGYTPLHLAAMWGNTQCAELLLKNGANVHARNRDGRTPLHRAASNNHHQCMALLVRYGADVEALDNHGWTPLHCATCCGSPKCIRELLTTCKADIFARTKTGTNIEYIARYYGHGKLARCLRFVKQFE